MDYLVQPFQSCADKMTKIRQDSSSEVSTYNNAKFFTEIRQKMLRLILDASVIAVFIAVHTICDADTGVFFRDDIKIREITGMCKSTVYWAFNKLARTELIAQMVDGSYAIVGYEALVKMEKPSYFRLSQNLFGIIPDIVRHKNAGILMFALEILDCKRNKDANITRSIQTLIRDKRIGSTRKRALDALQLLRGLTKWRITRNSRGTDDLIKFFPEIEERDVEREKLRAVHGRVSRETKQAFMAAGGQNAPDWRELSRTTRNIIQYVIENGLNEQVAIDMGSRFGTICAVNKVKQRVPYLTAILKNHHLYRNLYALRSKARLYSTAYVA